jgi:hypothetical protein
VKSRQGVFKAPKLTLVNNAPRSQDTGQRAIRGGRGNHLKREPHVFRSPFLDPRGAAAAATATRSLGLLAALRAAPPVEDAGGGGAAPGSPRRRAAEAERTGRRGDAEQEEARTRLSMPPGSAA